MGGQNPHTMRYIPTQQTPPPAPSAPNISPMADETLSQEEKDALNIAQQEQETSAKDINLSPIDPVEYTTYKSPTGELHKIPNEPQPDSSKEEALFQEIKKLNPDSPLKWTNHTGAWEAYDPDAGTTIGVKELENIRDDIKNEKGLEFSPIPKLNPLDIFPWGRGLKALRNVPWKTVGSRVRQKIKEFRDRTDPRIKSQIKQKTQELKLSNIQRRKRAEEQGFDLTDTLYHVTKGYHVKKREKDAKGRRVPVYDEEGNVKKKDHTYKILDPDPKLRWSSGEWNKATDNRGYVYFAETVPTANQASQAASWSRDAMEDIGSFERRYNISWDDFATQYPAMLDDLNAGNKENEKMIKEFQYWQTQLRSNIAAQAVVVRGPVAGREIHVPSNIMEMPDEVTLDEYNAMMKKAETFNYTSLGGNINPALAKKLVKTNLQLAYSKFTDDSATSKVLVQLPDDPNRGYYTYREVLADEELKKRAFPDNYQRLTEDDFSELLDSPILPKEQGWSGERGKITLTKNKKLNRKTREHIMRNRYSFGDDFEFVPRWNPLEDKGHGSLSMKEREQGQTIIPYKETLKALGFTGSRASDEAGTSTAIFDPSAIRAPWARFSDKRKHSNSILASILLGGLITKGQLARLKKESGPQTRDRDKGPSKRKRDGRRTRE